MKKIISNTHHISFESFIISFKDLIKKFESYIKTSRLTSKDKKSKNRPIFIFIDKLKRDYKIDKRSNKKVLSEGMIRNKRKTGKLFKSFI